MPVLAVLAAALGGVIAIESIPDQRAEPLPRSAESLNQLSVAAPSGGVRQVNAWVATILARPLFEPSRRPLATATGQGAAGTGVPRLTGIVILPGKRAAIFAVPGRDRPVVVLAGSRIDGMLIQRIDPGQVVVVDTAGSRVVRPSFAPVTTQPAAPSAAAVLDLPPVPSVPPEGHAGPFAKIHGLSGRPLGLVAQPDQRPPADGGANNAAPSLAAPAVPGGSP
jgi:hypothetical protein